MLMDMKMNAPLMIVDNNMKALILRPRWSAVIDHRRMNGSRQNGETHKDADEKSMLLHEGPDVPGMGRDEQRPGWDSNP